MMNIYIVWALCSLVGIWRLVRLMSVSGRVGNADRLMIFFAMTPFSLMLTPILLLVEFLFWAGNKLDKFLQSPRYVTWKIERKIRKRRRGPLVRTVEYLHNKRKEQGKVNEKDIFEV